MEAGVERERERPEETPTSSAIPAISAIPGIPRRECAVCMEEDGEEAGGDGPVDGGPDPDAMVLDPDAKTYSWLGPCGHGRRELCDVCRRRMVQEAAAAGRALKCPLCRAVVYWIFDVNRAGMPVSVRFQKDASGSTVLVQQFVHAITQAELLARAAVQKQLLAQVVPYWMGYSQVVTSHAAVSHVVDWLLRVLDAHRGNASVGTECGRLACVVWRAVRGSPAGSAGSAGSAGPAGSQPPFAIVMALAQPLLAAVAAAPLDHALALQCASFLVLVTMTCNTDMTVGGTTSAGTVASAAVASVSETELAAFGEVSGEVSDEVSGDVFSVTRALPQLLDMMQRLEHDQDVVQACATCVSNIAVDTKDKAPLMGTLPVLLRCLQHPEVRPFTVYRCMVVWTSLTQNPASRESHWHVLVSHVPFVLQVTKGWATTHSGPGIVDIVRTFVGCLSNLAMCASTNAHLRHMDVAPWVLAMQERFGAVDVRITIRTVMFFASYFKHHADPPDENAVECVLGVCMQLLLQAQLQTLKECLPAASAPSAAMHACAMFMASLPWAAQCPRVQELLCGAQSQMLHLLEACVKNYNVVANCATYLGGISLDRVQAVSNFFFQMQRETLVAALWRHRGCAAVVRGAAAYLAALIRKKGADAKLSPFSLEMELRVRMIAKEYAASKDADAPTVDALQFICSHCVSSVSDIELD
jgi:hypothetical protein